ncbi:MAG: hypothetical protein RL017_259 [Pseudomonadota bacterium]|jgi:nitroreductase|nr:nitroreductase [Burkholderiales bacterium]
MFDLTQALLQRKSVRAFLDKEVKHEDIVDILDKARHAPSGTNTQPWVVAVLSGQKKKQLDALLLAQFENGVARQMDYNYYPITKLPANLNSRRVACGLQMYHTLGINREDIEKRKLQWGKNYSAFGAPVVLYFFADKSLEKGSFMDYGMFMQSIMLMAVSKGLGTCAQAALAEQPQIVRSFLGYSDNYVLVCGMALGYEDQTDIINSYRTPREEVTSFTTFFE